MSLIPANDDHIHHPVSMSILHSILTLSEAERRQVASEVLGFTSGILSHEIGYDQAETIILRLLRALTPGGNA